MSKRSIQSLTQTLALISIIAITGCGIDFAYLIPAAAGQLNILVRSVPIEVAIDKGQLTQEQIAKLELIRDVRNYARDVIGLEVSNNYKKFYNSQGKPVAFNVSASRKDMFEPRTWRFPIIGTVPYLGYFNKGLADAKFNELKNEGLDVFMYEIEAYSGIGIIPNLVFSPMLNRSDISIIGTIFHELLHSTIWRKNDTDFNESLATFYGRAGALRYLADRYPDQPEFIQDALDRFNDYDRYISFMLTLFNELDVFYSSDLSSEQKIDDRAAIFQTGRERFALEVQPLMNRPDRYDWVQDIPDNNAWMLGIQRYNLNLEIFEQVFFATDEDWLATNSIFHDATSSDDPYQYLLNWLTMQNEGS